MSDRNGGGFRREARCLDCVREYSRDRARERAKAGMPSNCDRTQMRYKARRFGVDPEGLVEFTSRHDKVCDICRRHVEDVHTNGRQLAVDHSVDGVRGMLCTHCNTGLGHFNDDPQVMARAIAYLAQPPVLPVVAPPRGAGTQKIVTWGGSLSRSAVMAMLQ